MIMKCQILLNRIRITGRSSFKSKRSITLLLVGCSILIKANSIEGRKQQSFSEEMR